MLGNIKFVGALLRKRMLASSVLVAVAEELVAPPCSAEALESVTVFLSEVGSMFDIPSWGHHARLNTVFKRIREEAKDKKTPARIRFLLQDLLDLRASSWEDNKRVTQKAD